MKGQLRVMNAKIKFSIQNFGENDKAINNSIYKAWVNNSTLNGIALKAITGKVSQQLKNIEINIECFPPFKKFSITSVEQD